MWINGGPFQLLFRKIMEPSPYIVPVGVKMVISNDFFPVIRINDLTADIKAYNRK